MARLPDMVNITSLSIPGTHDTMTYNISEFSLQCQNWNLTTQMNAGIRYFDIRARLNNDQLHIYHADEPTGFSYLSVLDAMFQFLDDNPSEMLIMRLKEEGKPLGINTISFERAFNHARTEEPLKAAAEKHLYFYNNASGPIPTIGQLRSKILILQNFPSLEPNHYGIAWDGPQMILQDKWIIEDVAHLPDKWAAIEPSLEKANNDDLDNQHIYLSHISASVGVLPIEAAAGPLNHTETGMNDLTGRWVQDNFRVESRRVGVVIFDFPGRTVIEEILKWNGLVFKGI
jgi:1-phosphatidylinositol phosphodiesterase